MLGCPICSDSMELRKVEDRHGADLNVFQCAKCLGFWVDGKAISRLSRDVALKLGSDMDFEEIFTKPREIAATCPRCSTNLVEQTGEGFPKGLHVDFCRSCQGFWFDKGELMIYKSYQQTKAKKSRQREGVGDISGPAVVVQLVLEVVIDLLLFSQ